MPLDKKDTGKDIRILTKENEKRKKARSRAQIIAIALSETGKGRKRAFEEKARKRAEILFGENSSVAQSVEQAPVKGKVSGPNPL